jgi:hypothetical protein
MVTFQFNPVQLTRRRTLVFAARSGGVDADHLPLQYGLDPDPEQLRLQHGLDESADLATVRAGQVVHQQEQEIGFELRLDSGEPAERGDPLAARFGIAPQLAALEQLVTPERTNAILRAVTRSSFGDDPKPPLVLFVFGRKRVLPVNITGMDITETDFTVDLDPVRATVAVRLTVIEGPNAPHRWTQAASDALVALSWSQPRDRADVMLPR